MAQREPRTPIDQFVDLFVYAPVGLAYEYKDVLPKLIKRGKSQVQIARLLGTMAAKQGQRTVESTLDDAVDLATSSVAQGLTEVGARIGLAPDQPSSESVEEAPPAESVVDAERPLPIANYDELTAKQIVALLGDLDAEQRARVAVYEAERRARKTVLAKVRALAGDS